MPISFDFQNSGSAKFTSGTGPLTNNNTDLDNFGGGQTVTFTISSDGPGTIEQLSFGNSSVAAIGLRGLDSGATPSGMDIGLSENDVFTLTFVDTANPNNTKISGTTGNQIGVQFSNSVTGSIKLELLSGTAVVGSTTITANDAGNTAMFTASSINGIRFTTLSAGLDRVGLTELKGNALNCFFSGSLITTTEGPIAVERLRPGVHVLTADGRDVEVRWLGQQFINTRLMHPAKVNPICISKSALSEGVPVRDLFVSPDHAIAVDGCLITAAALVNGESIYQVQSMPLDGFTYYHVETEAHELLLAEGCPVESFIDYADALSFDNGQDRLERAIEEMPLLRISSRRLVPETTVQRLERRAANQRITRKTG